MKHLVHLMTHVITSHSKCGMREIVTEFPKKNYMRITHLVKSIKLVTDKSILLSKLSYIVNPILGLRQSNLKKVFSEYHRNMKHFQIIQKNFAHLGISSNQSHYNVKSAIVFLFIGFATNCSAAFLFFSRPTLLWNTQIILTLQLC